MQLPEQAEAPSIYTLNSYIKVGVAPAAISCSSDPIQLIYTALAMGARLYANISGGKDGQAMSRVLRNNHIPIEGFMHCDLGRVEWPESMPMCQKMRDLYLRPLYIIKRSDGQDLIDRWQNRLEKLRGTGKPFWSSKAHRYCTSDMKRDPSDIFYRNCGNNLIIDAQGIRAEESPDRQTRNPLTVRPRSSSSFYNNMTAAEALANYRPDKRLVLTWYPIFNFTLEEVWQTERMSTALLNEARAIYKRSGTVPHWWPFHPAYVYGNDRVSCTICPIASKNDMKNGAKYNPALKRHMIGMEIEGKATIKKGWSLVELENNA